LFNQDSRGDFINKPFAGIQCTYSLTCLIDGVVKASLVLVPFFIEFSSFLVYVDIKCVYTISNINRCCATIL
jgi:hypothetical protein